MTPTSLIRAGNELTRLEEIEIKSPNFLFVIKSLVNLTTGLCRSMCPTASTTFWSFAALISSLPCLVVEVNGFSTKTCLPALIALRATS